MLLVISSSLLLDVVTEEVAKEGRALMYADDLVLICETKDEAKQICSLEKHP